MKSTYERTRGATRLIVLGGLLLVGVAPVCEREDGQGQVAATGDRGRLLDVVVVPLVDESHPTGSDPTVRSVRVTTSEKVQGALAAGLRYWHRRGKLPCGATRVYRLDRLVMLDSGGRVVRASGAARFGGCVVWLDGQVRQDSTDREDCALMTHELGHTAALTFDPHPPDDPYHALAGLMSPSGQGVVPGACRREFEAGVY